ncbi:MAG: hypothetical protein NWF07_08940, partial [Candidatus Bathyarchaeota archaeon]|nr:hypothetical protein [Candidatus Bathyarchaeota archaeon]
ENITTVIGLPIASIGLSRSMGGDFEELFYSNPDTGVYRRILLSNNRIIGVVLLGDVSGVGVLRYCIENKIDMTPWRGHIVNNWFHFAEIIYQQLSMAKSQPKNMIAVGPADDY